MALLLKVRGCRPRAVGRLEAGDEFLTFADGGAAVQHEALLTEDGGEEVGEGRGHFAELREDEHALLAVVDGESEFCYGFLHELPYGNVGEMQDAPQPMSARGVRLANRIVPTSSSRGTRRGT